MKVQKSSRFKKALIGMSALMIALVIVGAVTVKTVSAESDSVVFTVNVPDVPLLELTLQETPPVINANPSMATSDFATTDFDVTVGTSSPAGYNLKMTTNQTSLLRDTQINNQDVTIPTLAESRTESTFDTNHWGYKLASTNYLPVLASNDIASNEVPTNGVTSTITFATKIDGTQPAGAYTTTLTFVATANPTVSYIQNVTSDTCTTTASEVVDSRDEQVYTIKKLADGKCWMMTNLNLGAVTLSNDLTSANTNLATTVTAATFNSWKKSSGTGSYTAAQYIPVSGSDATSKTPYGTLYNYCAASAGTICTSSNSSNASYDLCPAGWRLPTGNTTGEFQALYGNSNYNTNAKMRAPETNNGAAFALAGYFSNAAPTNQGSVGYYWSSTRNGNTRMYYLRLDTSGVYPAYRDDRYVGSSIRCVLK